MFGDLLFSFSGSSDIRYDPLTISKLRSARIDLFNKGLILAISVCVCLSALMYGLIQKKIDRTFFKYSVIFVAVFDIWIVNSEFMNVKPPLNMDRKFRDNDLINKITKDTGHFRVFPADEMGSNRYSYWDIESIGGYRPIKLRNYQDLMDARGFSRPKVLDMLNVKYVITGKRINNPNYKKIESINGLYENKNVLPKSWIVGKVKNVTTQRESLMETLLSGFDPKKSAIVCNYIGSEIPENAMGEVLVKSRKENRIELVANSETGGLLVLSEIYYKPGWRAMVNGIETPIYQTNHIIRSIELPKGISQVVFEYDDIIWQRTRLLSRFSFLTVIIILGGLFWKDKKRAGQ
tara:strand:- start:6482 stop:7528 length:1047 start_codon:yes stop_codon:yes gene_type:complete